MKIHSVEQISMPDNTDTGWESMLSREEEARRKQLYDKGLSDKEIGERLGVTRCAIRHWRIRRGHEPNYSPQRDAPEHFQAVLDAVSQVEQPARTGEVYDAYKALVDDPRTLRRVLTLLKRHEDNGDLEGVLKSRGRYGRAYEWRLPENKHKDAPTQ